jgi:hypothetical protein
MSDDSLIEYPCDFPIKIMGARRDNFAQTIVAIVLRHAPDFRPETVEMRASKGGRYLSLTCTVRATSRQQLDDLYRALSGHPWVSVVL